MTRTVVADKALAFAFVQGMLGIGRTADMKGLVQLQDGEPIAAVVYDEYNGGNIFAHIAALPGRRWLNRWFLREMFKYPFVTQGCRRVTLWINSDNADSLRFAEHLGFRREAVLHKAGPAGQDVFLYVMFREMCRYA